MPSRNILKKYVEGGYYHIYNRGVEKRLIFIDEQDYKVFLRLFELSLTPKGDLDNEDLIRITNRADAVELVSYCLMPNHFHLILKQISETGMTDFMRSILTAYVAYFNKKYKRVGGLFQGRYKAVLIERDEYLSHLSRYVHMNPLEINNKLEAYPYSSYKYYLSNDCPKWLTTQAILELFPSNPKEYEKFVSDKKLDSRLVIKDLSLD